MARYAAAWIPDRSDLRTDLAQCNSRTESRHDPQMSAVGEASSRGAPTSFFIVVTDRPATCAARMRARKNPIAVLPKWRERRKSSDCILSWCPGAPPCSRWEYNNETRGSLRLGKRTSVNADLHELCFPKAGITASEVRRPPCQTDFRLLA